MSFAAHIEVNNSAEDPVEGRRGLREELLPALQAMPGFQSALLLTAHERGRGVAVVVFDTREQAADLTAGLATGSTIREGVTVTATDVFDVTANG